jgi:hypothetical protein
MEQEQGTAPSPRWRRWLLVLLIGVTAFIVALRSALPLALEWGIAYGIERETSLPTQIENVDLWLLRGAIAIEGPAIARRPGQTSDSDDSTTALLSWQRLYVDVEWTDLFQGRVHLQELALDGPRVRLETAPVGGVDLGFLEAIAKPEVEAELEVELSEAPTEPWPIRLDALVLRDVRADVFDSAADATPVEFTLAELSVENLTFEDGTLSMSDFGIREPRLRAARDFAQSASGAGGSAPDEEETSPGAEPEDGLRYRVEHLELEGAGLTLLVNDRSLEIGIGIGADEVTLRGGPFPILVRVDVGDGVVELEGSLGLIPLVYDGRLHWTDLPVPLGVLAANPAMVSWIRSCRAQGQLDISLRTEPGPDGEPAALRVTGKASADDLEIANPEDDEEVVLAWKQLSVGLREAVVPLAGDPSDPIRIDLANVRLLEPRVLYTSPAESLAALAGDAATEGEAPEEGSADDAVAVELGVDLVEVVDGDVRYVDRAVGYRGRVRDLDAALEGLRWPALALESARLTARPPKGKALSLSGSLAGRSGVLELQLDQLALPPLNPFSEPAGYRLSSGTVSLRTELGSDETHLEASNTIELQNLGVDALDADDFRAQFGMPLDLMVALLRDTTNKISLSVPLTVALQGGTTRVGLRSALQSALRQALVGAVSSPLKMGGFALGVVGLGGAASESLASLPGNATPADGQEDQLDAAVTLLAARPALGLVLRGRSGRVDVPYLAEQTLIERLSAGGDLPELEGAGLLARRRVANALRERGRGEPGALEEQDRALLARYAATVEVPEARLAALAQRRAETVREALLAEDVEEDRLSVGEAAASGDPGVLLELQSAR